MPQKVGPVRIWRGRGLGGTLGVWTLGWTWMDPVAALVIAYWVAQEAWEAFEEVRETEDPEPQ